MCQRNLAFGVEVAIVSKVSVSFLMKRLLLQGGQSSGVEKWGVPAFAAAAIGAGAYYYNSRSGVVQAGQLHCPGELMW